MTNTMNRLFFFIAAVLCSPGFASCGDYLNVKPDKRTVVPNSLDDLQALLDNRRLMNGDSPAVSEALADNYYTTFSYWNADNEANRQLYAWHENTQTASAWNALYRGGVYIANVVLDQLSLIEVKDPGFAQANEIRGSALFYRAFNFLMLAQLYCKHYSETDVGEPGIPLRLTAAITAPIRRNTIGETYQRIVNDLRTAADLLPAAAPYPTRPTKRAAYGLLARTYLIMGKYEDAYYCADVCLSYGSDLLDFNRTIQGEAPFKRFNSETIFFNYSTTGFPLMSATRGRVDTSLYASYEDNDLRKSRYFAASTGNNAGSLHFNCFQGDNNGQMVFHGLLTSEQFLIRAECAARIGDVGGALDDLNHLLDHRMDNEMIQVPIIEQNASVLLDIILSERRKELVNRGLRWSDLRRLNGGGAGITLTRVLGDQIYRLPPADPRWVLLIPDEVIKFSGIQQNNR